MTISKAADISRDQIDGINHISTRNEFQKHESLMGIISGSNYLWSRLEELVCVAERAGYTSRGYWSTGGLTCQWIVNGPGSRPIQDQSDQFQ